MNKRELIARVQRHMGAGATREAARAALNAVLDSILRTAEEEGSVRITHLGSFEYRQHRERSGAGLPSVSPKSPSNTRRLTFSPARRMKMSVSQLDSRNN